MRPDLLKELLHSRAAQCEQAAPVAIEPQAQNLVADVTAAVPVLSPISPAHMKDHIRKVPSHIKGSNINSPKVSYRMRKHF